MAVMTDALLDHPAPAVVIDKAAMTYRISSDEKRTSSGNIAGRVLRKITGNESTVEIHALKELSLVAYHGEAIGVIGLNGSGKSTLMNLICGKMQPTSGAVYASSTPIMLGVSAALVPDLSGAHNVILGCLAMGLTRAEIADRHDAIMDLAGLGSSINLPMRSYSAGMSSRLRFAIAAAIDPEILIIDEALNTGDDEFRGRTKKRMDELRQQAGCVFLVSHSMKTIQDLCTRIVWIDKGDLLFDGDTETGLAWYRKYTKELSNGDRFAAAKIRRRMQNMLETVAIEPVQPGRRKSVSP
ncbi:ABC transporter ATP-binding protein [Arthrobacter caoxuetaonis]|uniref:ABC transporter ATP-binding protein n=1 Tax=Arthrobacter caoxuetaonis TaxID=2886935 RepID=UPI001D14DCAC|nr:ATP-binding cassette domain-containing protein [Arthrobacter caoxuetaonis]MCC3282469.1 ATP-binding cassette domain-containing protein [Arthrobacter caoxuetaonis]